MRQLIRRFSRVSDSRGSSSSSRWRGSSSGRNGVPEGHVPVCVGGVAAGEEEEERFVVRAELLATPALAEPLGRAAQEYGYDHQGPLRIPCPAAVFRRALAAGGGEEEE